METLVRAALQNTKSQNSSEGQIEVKKVTENEMKILSLWLKNFCQNWAITYITQDICDFKINYLTLL